MRRRVLIVGAAVAALLLVIGAAFALSTWGDINRVAIERQDPGDTEDPTQGEAAESRSPRDDGPIAAESPGDGVDVFLLVGSDSRADLDDTEGFGEFAGQRADVVMVLLRPSDGSGAAILSIPRDLLVVNVCRPGQEHRLNDALEGCEGGFNGPTALTRTVEDLIGQTVDHFAMVDLGGFQEAVDAVGGYEICLERAVRDQKANLALPAGCTNASGAQTLAWLRSRNTQELTENGWRTVPGVSDLTRNQRQREFLMSMMSRLSDFSSPKAVTDVARVIAPYVTVDSELGILDAVDLAWTMRGLGRSIEELEIPVSDAQTSAGAAVLVAQVDVADLVDSYISPEVAEDESGTLAG